MPGRDSRDGGGTPYTGSFLVSPAELTLDDPWLSIPLLVGPAELTLDGIGDGSPPQP